MPRSALTRAAAATFITFAVLVRFASATGARNYKIQDTFIGPSFLSGFNYQVIPDPTNGRVNYVDATTAANQNLTFTSSDTIIIRADYKTVLSPSGPGRNSVRLLSNNQYTTGVTVLNLRHMPQGCGTWPAFWTTSSTVTWPNAGEIDIIEGVNDVEPNASTLHTTNNCQMSSANMIDTGTLTATNCYYNVNSNTGCSIAVNKANSYGPALNSVGGGWYAMERTSTAINMWFWARNDPLVPADVSSGAAQVNPAHWGVPYANFVNNQCNMPSHFGPTNLIINLTFCGDWAGNAYGSSSCPGNSCVGGCPAACVNYVNNNPAAFADAYWDIASLRVYQPGCTTSQTSKRDIGLHRHHHQRSHRHGDML